MCLNGRTQQSSLILRAPGGAQEIALSVSSRVDDSRRMPQAVDMLRAAIVNAMRHSITTLSLCCALALLVGCRPAAPRTEDLEPCRIAGIEREILCGKVAVAENPDEPAARTLNIHFAVVPAVARNVRADPVFVLAGGPGQAATRIAGMAMPIFAELNARRDIVFIDQRGTGKSNMLDCPEESPSLAAMLDPAQQIERVKRCLHDLESDTRQYATWIAVGDFDAIRRELGAERINLWGASYGTRAALEYLRQFPQHVRTVVLDGVAPPDMALPAAFSVDADAALTRLGEACAADADCHRRYPDFTARVDRLLERADRGIDVSVPHPLTGEAQTLRVDRRLLASLLRAPLYAPSLAAVLPFALAEAGGGDFAALVALSAAVGARTNENFALGMHFAVICAEDMPRVTRHDVPRRLRRTSARLSRTCIPTPAPRCRRDLLRPPSTRSAGLTCPCCCCPAGSIRPRRRATERRSRSDWETRATSSRHGSATASAHKAVRRG